MVSSHKSYAIMASDISQLILLGLGLALLHILHSSVAQFIFQIKSLPCFLMGSVDHVTPETVTGTTIISLAALFLSIIAFGAGYLTSIERKNHNNDQASIQEVEKALVGEENDTPVDSELSSTRDSCSNSVTTDAAETEAVAEDDNSSNDPELSDAIPKSLQKRLKTLDRAGLQQELAKAFEYIVDLREENKEVLEVIDMAQEEVDGLRADNAKLLKANDQFKDDIGHYTKDLKRLKDMIHEHEIVNCQNHVIANELQDTVKVLVRENIVLRSENRQLEGPIWKDYVTPAAPEPFPALEVTKEEWETICDELKTIFDRREEALDAIGELGNYVGGLKVDHGPTVRPRSKAIHVNDELREKILAELNKQSSSSEDEGHADEEGYEED
jgi:cell division protein FtsB